MSSLHGCLLYALKTGDFEALPVDQPVDERDALRTLLTIYDMQSEPHPSIGRLKRRLDEWLIRALDSRSPRDDLEPLEPAQAIAFIAGKAGEGLHAWLATSADWTQLTTFLAIDSPDQAALGLATIDENELPNSVLYARAFDGLLATNPCLSAERRGSAALRVLLDGVRCHHVAAAFARLGAPTGAYAAYAERSGSTFDQFAEQMQDADERTVRGARWRSGVDARLFRDLHTLLATRELAA